MDTEEDDRRALEAWIAVQPHEVNVFDVLETMDIRLIRAFITDAFRAATVEAAAGSERVSRLRNDVMRFFEQEENARDFLRTPHARLGGRTPLAVAHQSEAGINEVLRILEQAHQGGFA